MEACVLVKHLGVHLFMQHQLEHCGLDTLYKFWVILFRDLKLHRRRPEQESIIMSMIRAAAYRNNTLGLPKICPKENVDRTDRKVLFEYAKCHYTPHKMVVTGIGVGHKDLVSDVQK
ncbi:hypothetical protein QLX08_009324 [Tetragonisca angustula]|uniref:Uncharacterized protein n=1 Tax=Tetragonisca angustula TaxID=166442 RepID=A0AAW0ZGN0_9HYME